MKFDHLLQIYWTYKFLYGGRTYNFSLSTQNLLISLPGVSSLTITRYLHKLEINKLTSAKTTRPFTKLKVDHRMAMNFFLGQLLNVNADIFEWERVNSLRNFLVKSYKGRALAIGKPNRGQRTHSNAYTAKHVKSPFKSFISSLRQLHFKKIGAIKKWKDPRIKQSFVSRLTKIIRRRKKQLPRIVFKKIWF